VAGAASWQYAVTEVAFMKRIEIPEEVSNVLGRTLERISAFAEEHHVAIGVVEMAAGAALLTAGVKSGQLLMGAHVLATKLPALTSLGLGGTAAGLASMVGGIGVTALGGAFGVPALALIGGAAAVFGLVGYDIGEAAASFMEPAWTEYLEPGALAVLGVALMVDGARRALGEQQLAKLKTAFTRDAMKLHSITKLVIARTLPELREMAAKLAPEDAMDAAGGFATSATMAAAGAAAASAAAASSVTVLGSSTLGSAAVALGLVSAPLWPAIAGAAAAGTVGYVLWKAVRKFQDSPRFAEHGA
jgi:hypothetical protein